MLGIDVKLIELYNNRTSHPRKASSKVARMKALKPSEKNISRSVHVLNEKKNFK